MSGVWCIKHILDDAFGLACDAVLVSRGCATVGYPLAATGGGPSSTSGPLDAVSAALA